VVVSSDERHVIGAAATQEETPVLKTKKIAALVAATGGLVMAGAGMAGAEATAHGSAQDSPGIVSGNNIQVPVHVPVNACGITVSVIGILDQAFGDTCGNA
jgi:predicted Rossmann-fold nucleotide-binding protein